MFLHIPCDLTFITIKKIHEIVYKNEKMDKPKIELKLPIVANMELVAINTAEVVAKHMDLSEEAAAEISMALIEACINAFEHSRAQNNVFIHFIL